MVKRKIHWMYRGRRKKGVVEVQFNWIFVMIAGGVILIFFFNIAEGQRELFIQIFSGEMLRDLNTIFIGAEVSRGTSTIFEIPEVKLNFRCNDYAIGNIRQGLANRIVFAPNELEGRKLVTWSQDWNVPYRVTNFLFITSPDVQYVFVNKSSDPESIEFFRLLLKDLPTQMTKKVIKNSNELKDENYNHVRLVFYKDNDPASFSLNNIEDYADKQVSAVVIKGILPGEYKDPDLVVKGDVVFYGKKGKRLQKTDDSYYFGKAAMLAAIFSSESVNEDGLIYECIMKRAAKKMEIVTEIYKKRTEYLKGEYSSSSVSSDCYTPYLFASESLVDMKSYATSLQTNYQSSAITNIFDESVELKGYNIGAERASCPHIY